MASDMQPENSIKIYASFPNWFLLLSASRIRLKIVILIRCFYIVIKQKQIKDVSTNVKLKDLYNQNDMDTHEELKQR
jgi:hypothetical protein